jgi:putative nucleotidyltransferase with HDIG domain
VSELVNRAERLAGSMLATEPERQRHSACVAARAEFLAVAVEPVAVPVLLAAAWLHDVGYAAAARVTGFHPLDGARWLRAEGWDEVVCGLVAHHCGSRFVAAARGLTDELAAFPYVEDPVADALTVADQTIGPDGAPMTIDDRMRDMLARHGPGSANAQAHRAREPYLRAAATRVAVRLRAAGVPSDQHRIT